jgi:hypothetical protein
LCASSACTPTTIQLIEPNGYGLAAAAQPPGDLDLLAHLNLPDILQYLLCLLSLSKLTFRAAGSAPYPPIRLRQMVNGG